MDGHKLKVGDCVLITEHIHGFYPRSFEVKATIDRLTKTQIVIGKRRFKKDTLSEIGESWYSLSLDLSEDETIEYEEYKKKIAIKGVLPYLEDFGHFRLNAPLKVCEEALELYNKLGKVYKESQTFE